MAGSVNKVILVGNVGKDPEVRTSQDGTKIVNFSLATSENWTDRASGERKERTEWHRVVVFNDRIGEVVEKYSTEVVIGRFRGELTLLDGRSDGEGAAEGGGYQRERAPAARPAAAAAPRSGGGGPSWDAPKSGGDLDDEIPF